MQKLTVIFVGMILSSCFALSAFAATDVKIGYIDMKKAVQEGGDKAAENALKAMLPTWIALMEKETVQFMGMDKYRVQHNKDQPRRGVFFEFIPPLDKDFRIP